MPSPRNSPRSKQPDRPGRHRPLSTSDRPAPLNDRARHAAFRVLARQAKLFPDLDLTAMERMLESEPTLTDLDRAFAWAIYDATIRYWSALSHLLAPCVNQPLSDVEPRVRAALLAAAAQILILDRVPIHAAINHAVEWCKIIVRPGAGSLVNAVLRRFSALKPGEGHTRRERYTDQRDELPADDGGAIVLASPMLPESEPERLTIATGISPTLLNHWLQGMSLLDARRLCLHALCRPPVILNTAYASSPLTDPGLVPHERPGHHVFTGDAAALSSLLTERPDIWVQDPASALPVASIADLSPKLIVDVCAGQGTKTRQLAKVFPSASIIATEIDEHRFQTLQQRFKGSEQIRIVAFNKLAETLAGKADLVLLDVPCSNTGVLARRPEARFRFDADHLRQLTDLQKQIIADSLVLITGATATRGKILYATCSLEADENHRQVAWADHWHKLGISRAHQCQPTGLPGEPAHAYADGSYSALLG